MSLAVPVAVVGGGAAGLMAAISAAAHGASVTLLEGTDRLGTKILMSGGTRCNVTHDFVSPVDYYGGSRNVVARLLREFAREAAARFFREDLGVALKREDTGKLFPESDDAQTVLDALLRRAGEVGVVILTGRKVTAIAPLSAGSGYLLTTTAGELEAQRVILTTGGLSFPRTGSDGTGYALAQSLGHTIETTTPALTPMVARGGGMHERLRGVTLDVALTVRVAEKKVWEGTGSFLFTHFGYSGPVVLDASRHVARAEGPFAVVASFLPGMTMEAVEEMILRVGSRQARLSALSFVRGRVPESLAWEVVAYAAVPPDRPLGQLRREERRALALALVEYELPVLEVMGYRKAEVTAGGVPLSEVDPRTMESRRAPGLYLAGEILGVDGRLGGYNFQFAWSTGWIAGKGAARAAS
ncbi:MAG: aminoacetone oxidase family FAD-binding enzyme [Candidatus Eisenbacteria bacterium]